MYTSSPRLSGLRGANGELSRESANQGYGRRPRLAATPVGACGSSVSALRKHLQIFSDGCFEADVKGAADECVADRHFIEVRQCAKQNEIIEIEVVAGVHAQSQLMSAACGRSVFLKALFKRPAAFLKRA